MTGYLRVERRAVKRSARCSGKCLDRATCEFGYSCVRDFFLPRV
jgi:hypothetical protein